MSSNIKDLTSGNILKELFSLALPLLAISFIQMTYNLVDIFWIGRLGSEKVAAVGSIGMLMWMMNSVALISKVSAEISIGQSIGARRPDKASIYASHTTTIALILGILFGIIFFLFPNSYVSFYRLDASIQGEAVSYLRIITLGIPFMFLTLNFSGIYVGTGRSNIPFRFNAIGLALNIILDPLLIFGVGPINALGIEGAALATLISQSVVTILFIIKLKGKNGLLGRFKFIIKPRHSYTLSILKIGLPVAAMNVYFAFINMNLARSASLYGGHLGIMSQTTGGQIEGITWNTSAGFSTTLGSFVAQNYAANKMHRARSAFRITLTIMGILGIIVSLSFMLFGKEIFSLFVPEVDAYTAGGEYLFIMGISQIFMMLEVTSQGYFNGLGRTAPPAIVSMTLNTLRIPLSIILGARIGVNGVWWAISITSIIKGLALSVWLLIANKRLKPKQV
ncbi:MAG: MATE family efflux transporter [Fermentimonas sp.]|jgi:putative MATE family efflux protein